MSSKTTRSELRRGLALAGSILTVALAFVLIVFVVLMIALVVR